jgi:hypothetical protein
MGKLYKIINELQRLDPYALYRLSIWIRNEISRPQIINNISKQFKLGDLVTWFHSRINNEMAGLVESKGQNKVIVKMTNGERWNVPYYAINTEHLIPLLPAKHHAKLGKNDFKVGEHIEFTGDNRHYSGVITKLNPKTATIKVAEQLVKWRVSYCLLTKIIDSTAKSIVGELIYEQNS